jgi:regulator of sigma E protease
LTTLLSFLFVLGVLIFVHELGHFLMARRHGVRVITFSLGFGPKILKVVRNETEYCISVIPLGGYVKMAGETPDDPRSGHPDEFLSKTKWQRFQILFAGPAMNILLAVALLAFVLSQGVRVKAYLEDPPVVAAVENGSPAQRAGVMPGDKILAVAGREVSNWEQLEIAIVTRRADREFALSLLREGRPVTLTLMPVAQGRYEVPDIGILPDTHPYVLSVIPGDRAEQAGLKPGDVILSIDGQTIASQVQLIQVVSRSAGKQIEIRVRRGSEELTLRGTPEQRGARAMLGFTPMDPFKEFMPGPLEALRLSVIRNFENSGLIFRTLGGLFTGETSVKALQGPVGIAQLSGESAEEGFISLLGLMAMLSINLGIINLMPVPVLDGGHIVIMALEGIARRDFSMQVKEKMLLAGFVVLMMLMVTVIYNDLTRISWIERLMPWRN